MTDLDLRAGQIHRGLGVVARWPDIALVIPSDASHDAIVDQMFHECGPEPEAAQIVAAINDLLAAEQLKSVAMLVDATGGPLAMAFGPVEVLIDGEIVLEGSNGGVRRQISGTASRLILRAANLSKAAEPVAPYDLRRGVAPGAGLTLVTIGAVRPAKLDAEAPIPPAPPSGPPEPVQAGSVAPRALPAPPVEADSNPNPEPNPSPEPSPVADSSPSAEPSPVAELESAPPAPLPEVDEGPRSIAALAQNVAPSDPLGEALADDVDPVFPGDEPAIDEAPKAEDRPEPAPDADAGADEPSADEPSADEPSADDQPEPLLAAPAGVRSGRFDESEAESGDDANTSGAERAAPAVEPNPLEVPFRSVVLIGSTSPVAPEPLPLAGDASAPLGPEAIEAGRVEVQGILCTRQHFNNPDAAHCMVCGLSMLHLTNNMVTGLRPTLGFIVFDDGSTYGLDRSYVIGREPRPPNGSSAQLLVLRDNNETLSRTHASLRLDDWSVQLLDQGSTNGTYVWDQVNERWNQLSPGAPVALRSGDTIALGRRTFVFESVSRN